MEAVGITDLRRRTSAIIKRVREENEVVNITYRGKSGRPDHSGNE